MASNTYTQYYANGTSRKVRRVTKQGRKSSGLGKPILVRLNSTDEEKIKKLSELFGYLWNKNDFIRMAVSNQLSNSVYIKLLNT